MFIDDGNNISEDGYVCWWGVALLPRLYTTPSTRKGGGVQRRRNAPSPLPQTRSFRYPSFGTSATQRGDSMTVTPIPAAQYLRMSTEDQPNSIAMQRDAIQRYADVHG